MENWRQYLTEEEEKELLEEGWREIGKAALGVMMMGQAAAPVAALGGEMDVMITGVTQIDSGHGGAGYESEELPVYRLVQLQNELGGAVLDATRGTAVEKVVDHAQFSALAAEAHPNWDADDIEDAMAGLDSMADAAMVTHTNVLETHFSREPTGIIMSLKLIAPNGGVIGQEQGFIPQGGADTGPQGQGDASKIAIQDLVDEVFRDAQIGALQPPPRPPPAPDVAPAGSETGPTQDVEPERPSLRQRFQQRRNR